MPHSASVIDPPQVTTSPGESIPRTASTASSRVGAYTAGILFWARALMVRSTWARRTASKFLSIGFSSPKN